MKYWQTSRRKIDYTSRTLVMGILNTSPDSFSDAGRFLSGKSLLERAEQLISEGADIIDVGGESTRPGSKRTESDEELRRISPIVGALAKQYDILISIDTSKSSVAKAAIDLGAEIINDISGLRFDEGLAAVAADTNAGLILMHLRGTFDTMHALPVVDDIFREVSNGFRQSIGAAEKHGVKSENIALDIGIGFSKSFAQNLELIANLGRLIVDFPGYPILTGTSRKSFLGKILGDVPVDGRLNASIASAAIAAWNGANIVRVHDVQATVEALKVVDALSGRRKDSKEGEEDRILEE